MRSSFLSLPLLLLLGCEGSSTTTTSGSVGGAKGEPADASAAKGGAKTFAELKSELAGGGAASSSSGDAWEGLATAVGKLEEGELASQMSEILERRQTRRGVDDRRIERAVLEVVAAMAQECNPAGLDASFVELQRVEAASLEADRVALLEMLELAGPEGREAIRESAEPESIVLEPRQKMASLAQVNLPSWLDSETDADKELQARRLLIKLKFGIQGVGLDTETELASLAAVIGAIDPASATAPAEVAAGMATVDETLLVGQQVKFSRLGEACELIGTEHWLALLERGSVASYIGSYGGSSGLEIVSSPTSGAVASLGGGQKNSGQMGGAQAGGQMGGAQTGGQMGGGQMGGSQMGGSQMGGTQSGGQMGGTQSGGQMGGSQMGGTQSGGQMGGSQMGGTQSGGQMGGSQMGGTQSGGQMGGSQMGGTQSGGQMGGSQMGGTQSGGQMGGQQGGGTQSGGQMGGTQSGGQQGGGQMGGTQSGGQMGGTQSGGQMGGTQSGGQQGGGQMGGQQGGGQMGGQQGGGQMGGQQGGGQ